MDNKQFFQIVTRAVYKMKQGNDVKCDQWNQPRKKDMPLLRRNVHTVLEHTNHVKVRRLTVLGRGK